MALEFSIEDRRLDDDTHVIAVTGEVDLFTAPEFKERVMAPIAADVGRVVVDLTDATFIDSSSLGVLIGAHRRMRGRGGRLMVACDVSAILKTLRVTGLDGVFTVAPTVEEALAAPDPDAEAA
jgi:anti-sigma B factor antagonist